jgi:hypothetical protein
MALGQAPATTGILDIVAICAFVITSKAQNRLARPIRFLIE